MDRGRSVRGAATSLVLLLVKSVVSVTAGDGLNIRCTNDYDDVMFCSLTPTPDQSDCAEYVLVINQHSVKYCRFGLDKDSPGKCSCSVKLMLILGDKLNTKLLSGGKRLKSKDINVTKSIKPKAPTITSVNPTEIGNFLVTWNTNYNKRSFTDQLTAKVTYRPRGGGDAVESEEIRSTSYEILGKYLDPSTTYIVNVRSYISLSGFYSDNSTDYEFTTPASLSSILLGVSIGLGLAAVVITSVFFICCVRFKAKWWDKVCTYTKPSNLYLVPREQKVLRLERDTLSSINVCPIQDHPLNKNPWSQFSSTDTSCGSYEQSRRTTSDSLSLDYNIKPSVDVIDKVKEALRDALPRLPNSNMDSSLPSIDHSLCNLGGDDFGGFHGSHTYDNRTYSTPLFGEPDLKASSEVQAQPAMCCEPGYHPSEGSGFQAPTPQATGQPELTSLAVYSSNSMQTDLSYQPYNMDSENLSSTRDSSCSSFSSGINCSVSSSVSLKAEARAERLNNESGIPSQNRDSICDAKPCVLQIDKDYQGFQSLVRSSYSTTE